MKDKLLALLALQVDADIKSELLEDFIKLCCEEYLNFSATRNELLVSNLGLLGFVADCKSNTSEQIWEYFKNYLKEK
jgi:hypothetical protein